MAFHSRSILATTASAILALAMVATAAPAVAATSSALPTASAESVAHSRSFEPDATNTTGVPGLSGTVAMDPGDRLVVSEDAQTVRLLDERGDVVFTLSAPTLTLDAAGTERVASHLVVVDAHVVISPDAGGPMSRSACWSSFWGNVIFNVGMTGVCAGLAIGTVVGGVVCTAALIGANTQINFDSQC